MEKCKLKVGRIYIYVNKDDIILDNGSLIQFLTRSTPNGWFSSPVVMSHQLFKTLRKKGILYTDDKLSKLCTKLYPEYDSYDMLTLYKFNMDLLIHSEYNCENGSN